MTYYSLELKVPDISMLEVGDGMTTDDEMKNWKSHNDTCSAMVKVV